MAEYDFLQLALPFIDRLDLFGIFSRNHTLMNILPETFNCGCPVFVHEKCFAFLRLVYSKNVHMLIVPFFFFSPSFWHGRVFLEFMNFFFGTVAALHEYSYRYYSNSIGAIILN